MQDKKEKKSFDRPKSTMKHIRFEDELLAQIEAIAGNGNFSSWVKGACRDKLEHLGITPKG
ncbi:YlcI/YnfO family protein [Arsenophonus nasoniae]|uniref:YlcI/YnfO family protein n=1 Tax=Arsenophonus nasoniae TaxID=638 RepID=A0AA95GP97_9GAMM|nr:YlcI/YnfO family protein [Arsenophonus nasoniae]WGM00016.1 YlcI/YnfO family protein [Arsenophonus nasoniae]WGM00209.1 YlcI/YnfO family protein [Arsenophonus nasoniae]